MNIRNFICFLLIAALLSACGTSYEEKQRRFRAERAKRQKEDSLALKIGVMPTLDCLPIYVAKEACLFDTAKADIRLLTFTSQIDCDAALDKGRIEGGITDIVRGQYMKSKGTALDYVAATNAYWQLISNRAARIREISQLNDKMIAMARFSATALLADHAVDSVRLGRDNVFNVQINDVDTRLKMLLNNEMDAMLLTEPQATTARLHKHNVLMDSRQKDMRLGVVAFNVRNTVGEHRRRQLRAFIEGYDAACDSINKYGVWHYSDIMNKYYKIDGKTLKSLPGLKFDHARPPRQKDIETADRWLKSTSM